MDVPGFALVAGAASGIGKACAMGFAAEGSAGVAMLDLNEELLQSAKEEVLAKRKDTSKPFKVLTYVIDIGDEDEVNKVVNEVGATFGRLDYMVNCAGLAMKHEGGAAFVKTEDWDRILKVNLTGNLFLLRAAAQIMLKQEPILSEVDGRPLQRGSIINFSSIQGLVGITLSTAYAATKAGVLGLTRTASEDYSAKGVRVNAICPGYTETPMTTKNPEVLKAMLERVNTAVPMQRMGKAQEIADGVLYLAGGRSSFVTGIALSVDGGYCSR